MKKGYFTIEAVVVLGLFLIISSSSILLVSSSLMVENKINSFATYEKNFINMEFIQNELDEATFVEVIRGGAQLNIITETKISYLFSANELVRRDLQPGLEVLAEKVKGSFQLNNNLLRLKIFIGNKEEEYVHYTKK